MIKKTIFIIFLFLVSFVFANERNLIYLGAGINNFRRPNSRSTEFRLEFKSKTWQ